MQFLIGVIAIMGLIYYGTGYLGVSDHARFNIAVWGGLALGVLGAIGNALGKATPRAPVANPTREKSSKKQAVSIPSGKYTGGAYGDQLDPAGIEYQVVKIPLHMKYEDQNGEITDRDVVINSVDYAYRPDGVLVPYKFEAYCRLRRAQRTFYAERILLCSDGNNRTAISDLNAYFQPYLEEIAPYRRTNQIFATQKISMLISYQFRKPNYKEQKITVVRIGFYQGLNHNPLRRTLSYLEGIRDGKEEIEKFKLDRLGGAYDPATGELIDHLSDFLINKATGPCLNGTDKAYSNSLA